MTTAANRRLKQERKRLQTAASRLARDAHMFSEGASYEVDLSQDAERLVKSAVSVLRFAVRLESLKEDEENDVQ